MKELYVFCFDGGNYSIILKECLEMGMDWTLREGYSWAEDKEHCEEYGRMLQADSTKVSPRAKKRGLPQVIN